MSEKNLIIPELLDLYGGLLTERQRTLTQYYYNDDLSLGEIAEIEGISRAGARDFIKKAEIKLNEYENALHLLEQNARRNEAVDGIRRICGSMKSAEQADVEKILKILDKLQ